MPATFSRMTRKPGACLAGLLWLGVRLLRLLVVLLVVDLGPVFMLISLSACGRHRPRPELAESWILAWGSAFNEGLANERQPLGAKLTLGHSSTIVGGP